MHVRVILFLVACAKTVTAPERDGAATASEITEISEITEVDGNAPAVDSSGDCSEEEVAFDVDSESRAHDAHALYADKSCEFARWTMNKLRDTLEWLKEFDVNKNDDNYFRNDFLVPLFERSIEAYKKAVDGTVARFVRALHAILDAGRDVLYYSDKSVLKALVSLRIKSHYYVGPADGADRSSRVESVRSTVRLMLEDMTALQSYHSMNCTGPPSADQTSYFYGFSTDNDDGAGEDVQPRNVRSAASPKCTVPQTMWRTLVPPTSPDDSSFLDRLRDAEVAITEGKWMTIGDVLLRVVRSHDSNVIFWYPNSVFNAIVKTLLDQVIDLSLYGESLQQLPQQSSRISIMIERFYNTLSREFDRLPETLVNVTTSLYKTTNNDDDATVELWKVYEKINESIRVQGKQTNETEVKEYIDDLEEILTTISDNIIDFKCYQMSFKYLHDEHKRAYVPFVENKEDLLTPYPAMENDESENTCKFLLNTYTLCFEIFGLTNSCREKRSTVTCARFSKLLSRIKNYFLIIVKNPQTDVSLRKMAHTVATILVNLTIRPRHNTNYINNVQQILGVIMTELNNNGLKYCTKTTFNFLLFNNINFGNSGKIIESIESIESSIEQYLIKFDSNLTDDHINKCDSLLDVSNILSLKYLYKNFIKYSNIFNYYGEKIQFYWKGAMKSTKTIYKSLTLFASNPLDLNAFYDIYFKFYIAVVYYEVRNFLVLNDDNDDNESHLKYGFNVISNKLFGFTSNCFPNKLEYIISDIQSLYLIPQDEERTLINDLHKRKKKIDEEFKKLNIIIETESNKKIGSESKSWVDKIKIPKISSSSLFSGKTIKMFATLNSEISEKVNKVNSYFLTYGR